MIRRTLENPYLVVVAALAVLVLGVVSYRKIPSDLLPMFDTPAMQIVTFYPGMPPEVMEKDIMSRLQRWTGQSMGIEHQEAKAMQGVCIVKDFFNENISMDTAMSQVSAYAMSDMFYLPPGTIPPMVMPFDPTASVPLCLVVVSNEKMDEQRLYDIAYFQLRNKLQSIQGVIAPAVYGGKLRRIMAYVDGKKLEAYGLSLMDVQRSLLNQNVLIPAGNMKLGKQDLQIYTNAIPETIEELNDAIITDRNGVPVRMGDIGQVENSHQIQSNVVRVNGKRQVYIPIYRQPGANTIEIVKRINKLLPTILTRLQTEESDDPRMETLRIDVAMDQSIIVRESIVGLQVAAGLGAGLAGLVVFFFLRGGGRSTANALRSTGVIVMAIPLAILAAMVGLYFGGQTINSMTLGGLALAIGILVDQSIVVLENVTRHRQMGKKPMQAAYDGAREVAIPLLVSTLTFIVVFFPIVFLSGMAKFLFAPLAIAASIAIFASYLLSITLIPAYCAKFLRSEEGEVALVETAAAKRNSYGRLLDWAITARYGVALVAFALFGISMMVMYGMGRELIPPIESAGFQLTVRMPTGTNIDESERVVAEIEQVIKDEIGDEGLELLISNIGVLMDWPAAYTPNNGPMDAFMLVQLNKKADHGAFEYVKRLRKKLNDRFGGDGPDAVEFAFDTGGMMTAALNMGEPSPIHYQVESTKFDIATDIAEQIMAAANSVEGTRDVRIAQRYDYPAIQVEMDRELAARQGVTTDEAMKNLIAATNSTINFDPAFWIDPKNGNHYFFGVQYREEDINSLDTLRDIPLGGDPTHPRRLGNLAKFKSIVKPAVVNHRNISRVTDVYINVDPAYDVGRVAEKITAKILADPKLAAQFETDARGDIYRLGLAGPKTDKKHTYEGMAIRPLGEVKEMSDTFRNFIAGLWIAVTLVYLMMVPQFRSFIDPLIVLLSVPLGFIGVAAVLVLTGTNLSIMSFMGIIMVVGIVVEYSIVLVDFANHRVNEGMPIREAILDAAQVRLRPILMTSLTTWLALLPMAVGFGGGEANAPLARTIIGGVLGATVLSLIVVPCLYVMMKRPPKKSVETLELATS